MFHAVWVCVEDVVYLKNRKLGRDRVARLASCEWVEACEVAVVISRIGCGHSFFRQAHGNAARRRPFTVCCAASPTSRTA